jgi:hypothetical protein
LPRTQEHGVETKAKLTAKILANEKKRGQAAKAVPAAAAAAAEEDPTEASEGEPDEDEEEAEASKLAQVHATSLACCD